MSSKLSGKTVLLVIVVAAVLLLIGLPLLRLEMVQYGEYRVEGGTGYAVKQDEEVVMSFYVELVVAGMGEQSFDPQDIVVKLEGVVYNGWEWETSDADDQLQSIDLAITFSAAEVGVYHFSVELPPINDNGGILSIIVEVGGEADTDTPIPVPFEAVVAGLAVGVALMLIVRRRRGKQVVEEACDGYTQQKIELTNL